MKIDTCGNTSPERFDNIERHTIGRAASAVRVPFALLTTIGLVAKIAIKIILLKPAEEIANLTISMVNWVSGRTFKTLDFGGSNKTIIKDVDLLKEAAKSVFRNLRRTITAPSEQEYFVNWVPLKSTLEKWATQVFTNNAK